MNRDVGFAFPFEFARGRVRTTGGTQQAQTNSDRDEAVVMCGQQVLLTNKGERVMLNNFGAGLSRFLFGTVPGTETLIPREIRAAMEDATTRVSVSGTEMSVNPQIGAIAVRTYIRHNGSDRDSVVGAYVRRS